MNNKNIFYDLNFFIDNPEITENNILQYFKLHPSYDMNCLNERFKDNYNKMYYNEIGVFYIYEKINTNYYIIKKYLNEADKKMLLIDCYMVINKYIIDSVRYKQLIQNKLLKITEIIKNII